MTTSILAVVAIVISVLVLLGWAVGWPLLTTWIANAVAMKVPTAIATMTQGVGSLLAGERSYTARRAAMVLSVITIAISHGSLMLRFSAMMIDGKLYDQHSVDSMFQVPSVATAASLMLLSISMLLYQFKARTAWPIMLSQFVALTIGTSAVAGQLLDLPQLYGYLSDYSGGVALPTGVCVALLALHGISVVARDPLTR